jgi:hypothetical protein
MQVISGLFLFKDEGEKYPLREKRVREIISFGRLLVPGDELH